MHPTAGIRPKIVPVQTGAKNAPMQKVHRCRLYTPTCPACRRSYLAAASSSLTPARLNRVQNDPRQIAGDTSCILQPVAFCNCCSTTKRKPLTLLAQRGRQMGGKVSRQYRPHYIKNGGLFNDHVSFSVPCAVFRMVPAGRCGVLEKWVALRGGHSYDRQKA